MQNLQINQPNQQQSGNAPRPPNATPFCQQALPFACSRSGPPPPGVFPRGLTPPSAQSAFPPNMMMSSRPSGPPPPVSQPPPVTSRLLPPGVLLPSVGGPVASRPGPRPGPFSSTPPTSGPTNMGTPGYVSNGPPAFGPGTQTGPRFPPAMGSMPRPSAGPPQMPQMRPSFGGSSPTGSPPAMGQPAPPFSAPPQNMPPPPGSSPILGELQSWALLMGSRRGHSSQGCTGYHQVGAPPQPNQSMGMSETGQSKIDPNQIPRLTPSSAVILHETREGNQANPPPPAISEYIVKDTGNCSPRYMRYSMYCRPSIDICNAVGFVGPAFSSSTSVLRNPSMLLILGKVVLFDVLTAKVQMVRRRDADERPELCRGTVEFVATKEYMVRDPMPAVFFFLIDVSMNAIQTGATAAACGPSPTGSPPAMGQPAPPFSAPPQNMPLPPGSSPFPFGLQWDADVAATTTAAPPPIPGPMQQPRMYGIPPGGAPPPPNQSMGMRQTGQSKIDPNQIPRLTPSSALILHETPCKYIVKDTGNCIPRYMRCTINQIPCTVDLLSTSAMQLALLVQPLALPHPSEEPIHVVGFGESGPVRCSRCKGYINPFVRFIDHGRRFICNLCGFTDETPSDSLQLRSRWLTQRC
ncbi:protein transport protein sec24-like at4g32640 [Phtheirospermum japonicum]|uniref:Protein transport protein sec24-like at4g32640 n=1 Tax=Phtheirospermum japonicum TaxID=374723 RepID=A0A830CDU0_9LAMI|nr:protein transport protein sec24-like at4g32640 [Phtheirospermum japonicum]